jgi:hypothetical protein
MTADRTRSFITSSFRLETILSLPGYASLRVEAIENQAAIARFRQEFGEEGGPPYRDGYATSLRDAIDEPICAMPPR